MSVRIKPLIEVPRVNNSLELSDLNPDDAEAITTWVAENAVEESEE